MNKILIVDDDADNRMVVANTLLKLPEEYQLFVAVDGAMAVKIALKTIPDLILLDWEMPRMNGIEALKVLKAELNTEEIPVIMYTGIMTSSNALKQAIDAGAIDFLRKPVEPVELLARISGVLRLQASIQARIQAEKDKAILIKEIKEKELSYKTQELAGLITQIEQSNSFLNTVHQELENVSTQIEKAAPKTALQKLNKQIKKQTDSKQQWEILQTRMEHIHSNFLSRLTQKHPQLTKGELKFCAFVRLNLARKEIASILGISVDAVQKKHTRLRKKINLRGTSLEIYLQNI